MSQFRQFNSGDDSFPSNTILIPKFLNIASLIGQDFGPPRKEKITLIRPDNLV